VTDHRSIIAGHLKTAIPGFNRHGMNRHGGAQAQVAMHVKNQTKRENLNLFGRIHKY
jgi:hypothetical protein